ncbi:MAG: HIT domain-containing protein [Myxococcota bacterium]
MAYIEGHRETGCIFCDPATPRSDRDRLIVHRAQHVFVLLNRYPYAPGHLMVAPYVHDGRIDALSDETRLELMAVLTEASQVLEERFRNEGLNIGANLGKAAGAGFADHLHFHLVPRWVGDTNFMTVIGETRVIPQHLDTLWEEISAGFRKREAS